MVFSYVLRLGIFVSIGWAVFLGYPHRQLDYENTIIPMLSNYSGNPVVNRNDDDNKDRKNDGTVLNGTVILITGATSGIGLSVTRFVSKFGATVVALGRSKEKLEQLRNEFPHTIVTIQVDQSSLQSVSDAANEIRKVVDQIHIVVNNAGMHTGYMEQIHLRYDQLESKTPGLDNVFVVNYLSHFLLTEKIADLLHANKNGVPPKIVQISSAYHWASDGKALMPTDFKKDGTVQPFAAIPGSYRGLKVFRGQQSYANSKLAQIYHARALQLYHETLKNVTIKSVCPLWVGTEIARESPLATYVLRTHAFPVTGWGISSAIHAMFYPYNDPKIDYIANANIYPYNYLPSTIMQNHISRDIVSLLLTQVFLFAQKFLAETLPQSTSPESYNITITKELYEWSRQAVATYI